METRTLFKHVAILARGLDTHSEPEGGNQGRMTARVARFMKSVLPPVIVRWIELLGQRFFVAGAFASRWDKLSTTCRRSLLERTQRAADKSGVCPHLYAGTLLGYVREGKILDWDDDIDLALFCEANLHEFIAALRAEGLCTFFSPNEGQGNVKIYDESYEPIPGSECGPYTWPYIDLFLFQSEGESLVCKCPWAGNYSFLRCRVLPSKRSSIFEGCRFWVPEDEGLYMLDINYPDWRTYEVAPGVWNHRLEKPSTGKTKRRAIVTVNGRKMPRRRLKIW
jgi:LicD family